MKSLIKKSGDYLKQNIERYLGILYYLGKAHFRKDNFRNAR
ncbi:unnamed protein product, partial [marine sediment metagenome]